MERNPHLLIEGCAIGCYAIGAKVAYIYIRGEFFHVQQVLEARDRRRPTRRATSARTSSARGFDCDVYVHRGAGAYEAGEETALLESLEGKRAQPRIKPPFPAVAGLYSCPTAVNNVETLCNVPLDRRATAPSGSPRSARRRTAGRSCICVSGHVKRPGVYEASMNITLRELIYDYAGGVRDGRTLKAVIPGGSSVPILLPDQLDIAGQLRRRRRRPGRCSARPASSCSTTRPAWSGWPRTCCTSTVTSRAASARRAARAATGCYKILQQDRARRRADEATSTCCSSVANNIAGKTLCAFGDAAATPVLTTLKHFRHEYEAHIREGRCTLPADWRAAATPVGAH